MQTTAIHDNVNSEIQVWCENKPLYFVQAFLEMGLGGEKKNQTDPLVQSVPDSAQKEQSQNFLFRSIKPKLNEVAFWIFKENTRFRKDSDNQQPVTERWHVIKYYKNLEYIKQ